MIPTGRPVADEVTRNLEAGRPLDSLSLDDVFLGSSDGAEILWPGSGVRVRYSCSRELGHTVVFTGAPDTSGRMPEFFCLEPVSMVNDGFNLATRGWEGAGVRSLE